MFEWLEQLDREILLGINAKHHPVLDSIMWFLSQMWPTVLLVFIMAFFFYRRYTLRKGLEFLLGCAMVVACTDVTTNLVKHSVKRYRPTHNLEIQKKIHVVHDYRGGKYSYFSAHASNTFGVIVFMYLCMHFMKKRYRVILFMYPLLVMYSRLYLGVHYPSDVLTGFLAGLLFGWLGYRLVNSYFLKLEKQQVA